MGPYFRAARKFLAPSWLTEGEGELVGYTVDALKDAFAERLRYGLLARFPQNDPTGNVVGAPDTLAAMGRDRRVIRGLNETPQSYARRLIAWLDDRRTAGNAFALMQRLAEYTGPLCSFRTVDVRGNWYSRAADGTRSYMFRRGNWDWDNTPIGGRWSKFWIIIYPNGLWTEGAKWGDAGVLWGDPGRTWGSTATLDEVDTVRAIVADWKPAGTRCVNIILAFDPASFDPSAVRDSAGLPNGLWATWSHQSGGAQLPSRLSTARYWDGV